DSLAQRFPDHASFFDSSLDSISSNAKQFGGKTHIMGPDSGIFTDIEDTRSHVPDFSSSSKTSTVRKQHITKSYKLADEAGTEAEHESLEGSLTTTKRGRAKSRTSRGIRPSPLEKSSL
ncbi:hypothetical protein NL503_26965, partial [Klebsiella pneumoniae]|nr:hypothetical protein [Klebsiella pneumoniae]